MLSSMNEILNNLEINYDMIEHQPLYTVKDAQIIKKRIKGVGVKNLFLKDKNNFYLLLLRDNKKACFKELENKLNIKHLTMASVEELKDILNLEKGSVTPLGIINDINNRVKIIIDNDLKNKRVLVHPLVNTKTIALDFNDLIKFIMYFKHEYIILELENISC